MWNCLPLFSSADAEDYYKTATAVRKKDDDAAATEVFVAEACEQALVAYFHRVIEKVEKLEYYD